MDRAKREQARQLFLTLDTEKIVEIKAEELEQGDIVIDAYSLDCSDNIKTITFIDQTMAFTVESAEWKCHEHLGWGLYFEDGILFEEETVFVVKSNSGIRFPKPERSKKNVEEDDYSCSRCRDGGCPSCEPVYYSGISVLE